MLKKLFRWFAGPGARESVDCTRLQVVLYTRQGCHLCEAALHTVDEVRTSYPFTLSVIDVDSDLQLRDRFGEEVPVVMVNGKVRFRGRVNRALLQRLLYAEGRRRAPAAGED
jgi:glutaredoxin